MPSPVGHALGGIAVGCLLAPGVRLGWVAAFGMAGALPDLDFLLPLQHRGPSHSVGAAAVTFGALLTLLSFRPGRIDRVRLAAALAAAYASHTLLDWLGEDAADPRGLMALWPLSSAYYISGLDVFSGVSRRYWAPEFWRLNGLAVARELVILAPIAALATWRSARRPPITSA